MSFLAGLWGRMAAGAAIAGAVLLAVLKIRQGGKDAERVAQAQRTAETREKADEVDRMVDAAGDVRVDELRNKWTRQ